jgi:NAD(P)-dependent dehydrogenase (short-subunit alcohol dehydrogenase family)
VDRLLTATVGCVSELPDLSGTVVLVTGSGRGIGAGIAHRFAAAGAAVVVTSVDSAEALAGELTARGGAAVERFGRLDTVVASAGVQPVAEPATTAEQWREVVDTNLTGAFVTLRQATDVLPPGGSVTLVASVEGTQPAFAHTHYAASKAGVVMLARGAALELGAKGIRVNAVSPGLVEREGPAEQWPEGVDRWARAAPLTRLGTPEDVGNACVFLASPLASWITGHNLVVDGGVSTHPTW